MRVLILGAAGMLGHKLVQHFRDHYDLYATVRGSPASLAKYDFYALDHIIGGVDVFNFDTVIAALAQARPQVVINCVGVIKQLAAANDPVISLTVNALFPHRLAVLCSAVGARLIHISTDCVFNGRRGMYTEADPSDAEDLYGRTKYLGEVGAPHLTLRTSIIGRELNTCSGLVEWFLSNHGGAVKGYQKAIYSGFTTPVLAQIMQTVIDDFPQLSGVYQVASAPISKYDLLLLLRTAFDVQIDITPETTVAIDRSLDSTRFRAATDYPVPSWPEMVIALAQDQTPYARWKS